MMYDQEILELESSLDSLLPETSLQAIYESVLKNLGKDPKSTSRDAETMNAKRAFCYLAIKHRIHAKSAGSFIGLDRVTANYHYKEMKKQVEFVRLVNLMSNEV